MMKRFLPIGWFGLIVFFLFVLSIMFAFNPNWQKSVQAHFQKVDREILSIATGKIFPDGQIGKVLKIRTKEAGLVLEVYRVDGEGVSTPVDTIVIGVQNDAQFQFQGRATNLALKDLNNDGSFEIIAPSFDRSMVSHLNIFSYNPETQKFEAYYE